MLSSLLLLTILCGNAPRTKQNDSTCYNYDYDYVDFVSRTTSANESVVAFKVNSLNGTCPTGAIPPTFDNQNATVSDVHSARYIHSEFPLAGSFICE